MKHTMAFGKFKIAVASPAEMCFVAPPDPIFFRRLEIRSDKITKPLMGKIALFLAPYIGTINSDIFSGYKKGKLRLAGHSIVQDRVKLLFDRHETPVLFKIAALKRTKLYESKSFSVMVKKVIEAIADENLSIE
jgi:hypothetical protein